MAELTDIEIRRKQALFRAQRRGFRELDLIFAAFTDAHLETLDEAELDRFEALLSVPDWQMIDWIMGHEKVPATHDHAVFARLCAYRTNLTSQPGGVSSACAEEPCRLDLSRRPRSAASSGWGGRASRSMERLTAIARAEGRTSVSGAPEGYDAYVAAEAAKRKNALVLFVAADDARAAAALEAARFFAPDLPVLYFPAWDCLPYDRVSPRSDIEAQRLATLSALAAPRRG